MSNKQVTKELEAIICKIHLQLEESEYPKIIGEISSRLGEAVNAW